MLLSLASGSTLKQAAVENDYKSFEAISRLSHRPDAQLELVRLRFEASEALAVALPELVTQAIDVLRSLLESNNFNARKDAALFVLRHLGKPLLQASTANATATTFEGSLYAPDTSEQQNDLTN